jgi:N-methylhydantoinase B
LAWQREFRVLAERAVLTIRSDRRNHPPYGLFGGGNGGPSRNELTRGTITEDLPGMPMSAITMSAGDRYRHVSPGGGGVGSPLERDPDRVLDDVLDGKVSSGAARDLYRVVIGGDPLSVDHVATTELRLRRSDPAPPSGREA